MRLWARANLRRSGGGDPKSMRLVEDSDFEGKLTFSVMVSYSVLSLLVGIEFEAEIAIPTLLVLSIVGLILGERWIKNGDLHLLGIAWVIISMKVLYGHRLSWATGILGVCSLDAEGVGIVLCGLVLFNMIYPTGTIVMRSPLRPHLSCSQWAQPQGLLRGKTESSSCS